jgi:hypothetical protein
VGDAEGLASYGDEGGIEPPCKLLAAGVPVGDTEEHRSRAERRDEAVDATIGDQPAIGGTGGDADDKHCEDGEGPGHTAVHHQADDEAVGQRDHVTGREVELVGGERHHDAERHQHHHRLGVDDAAEGDGGRESAGRIRLKAMISAIRIISSAWWLRM